MSLLLKDVPSFELNRNGLVEEKWWLALPPCCRQFPSRSQLAVTMHSTFKHERPPPPLTGNFIYSVILNFKLHVGLVHYVASAAFMTHTTWRAFSLSLSLVSQPTRSRENLLTRFTRPFFCSLLGIRIPFVALWTALNIIHADQVSSFTLSLCSRMFYLHTAKHEICSC